MFSPTHKNQPSFSSYGLIREGKKSDLLESLEKLIPNQCQSQPVTDIAIIDGAALVNILKPNQMLNFQGLCGKSSWAINKNRVYQRNSSGHWMGPVWQKQSQVPGQTEERYKCKCSEEGWSIDASSKTVARFSEFGENKTSFLTWLAIKSCHLQQLEKS